MIPIPAPKELVLWSHHHVRRTCADLTLVWVWNVKTGECITRVDTSFFVLCIAVLENGHVVGGTNGGDLIIFE